MTTIFSFAKKHVFAVILACMVVAIAATRLPGLMHNRELHSDEPVFYEAASSVVTGDYTFSSNRYYPNGAYVLQMPFHFLGQVLAKGGEYDRQFMGRLASVFYFTVGAALGLSIVRRISRGSTSAMAFYAAIMSFSLFHIEQSRYGTGDAISFFLLMLVLTVLQIYQREGDRFYLLLASFFVGALTAVKFPLLVFIALPVAAAFLNPRLNGRSRVKDVIYVVAAAVAGILAFTPQFFSDNTFFMATFFREYRNYMYRPNMFVGGTTAGNFVSLLIYQLLYADVPFAPIFAVCGFIAIKNKKAGWMGTDSAIYRIVLPVLLLNFMLANCFASIFVFRTLYPYFVVCNLYAAVGLARLIKAVHKRRLAMSAAAVSIMLMVVRGGIFTQVLSQDGTGAKIGSIIESHEEAVGAPALSGAIMWIQRPPNLTHFPQPIYYLTYLEEAILPGEYLIIVPVDSYYRKVRPFMFGPNSAWEGQTADWPNFEAENNRYFLSAVYPAWYYILFGGWQYPSTLSGTEFDDIRVYYRDYGSTAETQAALEFYGALRNEPEWPAYILKIQERGSAVWSFIGSGSSIRQWLQTAGDGHETELFGEASEDGYYFVSLRGNDVIALQPLPGGYVTTDIAGAKYEINLYEEGFWVLVNGRRYSDDDFLFLLYDTVLERVMDSKTEF